jgi:septum formation protein
VTAPHKNPSLILASASPRRRDLLASLYVKADDIIPADIDESIQAGELPRPYGQRVAREKAQKIYKDRLKDKQPSAIILAADTVVGVGRRILPKTETSDSARQCLKLMSGRSHRVFTAVTVIDEAGKIREKCVETRLKMKRLSAEEIEFYLNSGEWDGKAGGYGIQGYAGAFITHLSGSYSNVVGLPLLETRNLLLASGYKL